MFVLFVPSAVSRLRVVKVWGVSGSGFKLSVVFCPAVDQVELCAFSGLRTPSEVKAVKGCSVFSIT